MSRGYIHTLNNGTQKGSRQLAVLLRCYATKYMFLHLDVTLSLNGGNIRRTLCWFDLVEINKRVNVLFCVY